MKIGEAINVVHFKNADLSFLRVNEFLKKGQNVALGSDGILSNWILY